MPSRLYLLTLPHITSLIRPQPKVSFHISYISLLLTNILRSGPTRKETTLSEAQSYLDVALANSFWNLMSSSQRSSILLEERALDSYHNILFSLTSFYDKYRSWPVKITVMTHLFKKSRMEEHLRALGLNDGLLSGRVLVKGVDPPGMMTNLNGVRDEKAWKGVEQAVTEWREDPHGRGEKLKGKRDSRNPWRVDQGIWREGEKNEMDKLVKVKRINSVEVLDEESAPPWQ